MSEKAMVVVPWHLPEVLASFSAAWGFRAQPDWLILEQDVNHQGCAVTKNRGIKRAMDSGADVVVILDSDCYPSNHSAFDPKTLEELIEAHLICLQPQEIPVFEVMTSPAARGVPYFNRTLKIPVAASIGWWSGMPDRDAARQLIEGVEAPMTYQRRVIYGRPAMVCGMNMALRAKDWWPWFQFINVNRMDDVFMSWLFCKEAARRHHCLNFCGPTIRHARQSNLWRSLIDEAKYLEINETLWSEIWLHPATDYATLRALIPVP